MQKSVVCSDPLIPMDAQTENQSRSLSACTFTKMCQLFDLSWAFYTFIVGFLIACLTALQRQFIHFIIDEPTYFFVHFPHLSLSELPQIETFFSKGHILLFHLIILHMIVV